MKKRFVYFGTKEGFNSATLGTEYNSDSIVFIGDSKEMWVKGEIFPAVNFNINDYLTKEEASQTYVTKDYAEETYLKEHQSLENYYTKSEVDGLIEGVDVSDQLVDLFDGASYDSESKKIQFKHGETVKAEIDATSFIKDGMVSNVEVKDGNLEITFNEDSGKETIQIAISDIFNADNYYSKEEMDEELKKYYSKEEVEELFEWAEY